MGYSLYDQAEENDIKKAVCMARAKILPLPVVEDRLKSSRPHPRTIRRRELRPAFSNGVRNGVSRGMSRQSCARLHANKNTTPHSAELDPVCVSCVNRIFSPCTPTLPQREHICVWAAYPMSTGNFLVFAPSLKIKCLGTPPAAPGHARHFRDTRVQNDCPRSEKMSVPVGDSPFLCSSHQKR